MFKNRKLYAVALILVAGIILGGFAPALYAAAEASEEREIGPLLLTLEELAKFNGQDGKPAYVAVDGIIYNESDNPAWAGGMHNGQAAGKDYSREIKEQSPHGAAVLARIPAVGRLVIEMTLDELKEFSGKDGKPAYVAVDGVIYDMTNSALWTGGMHNGQEAGMDLSRQIKELSPHGVAILSRMPIVGRLKVELTLEQLKAFNGLDGMRAFIAVDGVIYDVTGNQSWADGAHYGNQAGQDLTQALAEAPHGAELLENVVQIGVLVQ
ncbi:MAG: cytochrome b5 domain-containing protein [Eubacteriales bacterium]|nr:cytochrome b5 domain-containing protein [Eubacteriales bacterium]